jgi:subtilisin family serine protease
MAVHKRSSYLQKVSLQGGLHRRETDPAQYANAKLRLPQAHTLAHGANVTVAVIDSGIDVRHPEFAITSVPSFSDMADLAGDVRSWG